MVDVQSLEDLDISLASLIAIDSSTADQYPCITSFEIQKTGDVPT